MPTAPGTPSVAFSVDVLVVSIGKFVTGAVSWIGSYMSAITSNPLLQVFFIVAFVGLGVGLIKRIIRM